MLSRLHPTLGSRSFLNLVAPKRIQVACYCDFVPQVPKYDPSKRDLINFPRPTRLETAPEVRFGFIPKSWFDFLYPKTGVSGGYMLITGLLTFVISKEYFVITEEASAILNYIVFCYLIRRLFGDKIKKFMEEGMQNEADTLDSFQNQEKEAIKDWVKNCEISLANTKELIKYLPQAKRENIYLQMEASYRANLQEAYVTVKQILDYHVEKQNIERRIAQRHMVDWIINSVEESITPQIKKSALNQCLGDLKGLASRA